MYKAKGGATVLNSSIPRGICEGKGAAFNILICQDIARGYSRKGISPRCIMKIDLQKAFDSVHWKFLKELLYYLKFPMQFIT